MMLHAKPTEPTFRLPKIHSKHPTIPPIDLHSKTNSEICDYQEDDSAQVSKLEEWSMNKPNKKPRRLFNRNVSLLYKNPPIQAQKQTSFTGTAQFIQVQFFLAKIDSELHKIAETNYFSIYKNLQYCSGVYENSFNSLLKSITKYKTTLQEQLDQIQLKLQIERQQHILKVHQLQDNQNQSYKDQINHVREELQQKQAQIKPLRKIISKIDTSKTKVLKFCLALGYDVREQGLLWILKELGTLPKPEQFPSFLSPKQIHFITTKFTNQYEASHVEQFMKTQICGQSINEAFEQVNRRKRRQLSFIKQNEELNKIYTNRIKDYSRQKHSYLSDSTLQIAKQLQKDKPKPTRYEIIYKQATKKLNKICRQKIHPQLYSKANKQNAKLSKEESRDKDSIRIKEKKRSTIIIQEFSKMLNLSITQSYKLDRLYTKEEKQFQEILRQIRNQKYTETTTQRASISKFDQTQLDNKLRNPISILGCLLGWKKARKIIEQQMFGY